MARKKVPPKRLGRRGFRLVDFVRGSLNSLYSQTAHWGVGHLVLRALERQSLTLEVIFTAVWTARVQVLSQE